MIYFQKWNCICSLQYVNCIFYCSTSWFHAWFPRVSVWITKLRFEIYICLIGYVAPHLCPMFFYHSANTSRLFPFFLFRFFKWIECLFSVQRRIWYVCAFQVFFLLCVLAISSLFAMINKYLVSGCIRKEKKTEQIKSNIMFFLIWWMLWLQHRLYEVDRQKSKSVFYALYVVWLFDSAGACVCV